MDCSSAPVVYGEEPTKISSLCFIMGACGGGGHRGRYRDRCDDPWRDEDALPLVWF